MGLTLAFENSRVLIHEGDVLPRRTADHVLNRAHLFHDVPVFLARVRRCQHLLQPRARHRPHPNITPAVHPVHAAPREQRWVGFAPHRPLRVARVHGERDVKLVFDALGEELEGR